MRILALDTSGPVASVAIAEETDGRPAKLIGGFRLQSGFTHSQTLMPMLEQMRLLADVDPATIDYIAVASGPGSFTGLRIGASAAKGLAFALEKKVVPVPTLDAMAYQMAGVPGLVCPMMDARRSQVYTGVYTLPQDEPVRREIEPCAISVEELTDRLNRMTGERSLFFLGDGVPVYADALRDRLRVPYRFVPFHRDRQSAEAVCALAFQLVREGKAVDADAFAPVYLRPSQAERQMNTKEPSPCIHAAAHALEKINFPQDPWTEEMFRAAEKDPATVFLYEYRGGELAGLVIIHVIAGEGSIDNVSVSPAYRRQGIARRLLAEAMTRARENLGAKDFTLEVRRSNEGARALYESIGFVNEGIRPGYYEKPREDACIYWLRSRAQ